MRSRQKTLLLSTISTVLFFIPIFFWFHGLNFIGGDDTMLYYIFPRQMIDNYIFNIISDNIPSSFGVFAAQWYQFPFFFLLACIKSIFPFFHTQVIMYGLNLSLGFLFFYLLCSYIVKEEKKEDIYINILASLLYIFSIFSFYTLWGGLFVVYLVAIFPLITYLFLRSIVERKIEFIILSSLVISLFSILVLSTPWFILAIVAILPIIIPFIIKQFKVFLIHSFVFIILFLLFNLYWLYFLVYPILHPAVNDKSTIVTNIASTESIVGSENIIRGVVKDNNLIYPLFNLVHKNIQITFNWQTYSIFSSWHERFLPLNLLFIITIILAAVLWKYSSVYKRNIYLGSLISWLCMVYFYTVKVGDSLGVAFFLFFNRYIPGFAMFRNMYGKIAPAMPIAFAFIIAISLKILFDHIKSEKIKKIILSILFLIVIANAKPFIFDQYFEFPIWTTKNIFYTVSDFNKDFYDLTNYLDKNRKQSRVIWMPVSVFSYVFIRDSHYVNHYYIGLSPLLFLSHTSDISGLTGIPQPLFSEFRIAMLKGDASSVGLILKKLNVNYIIKNNDISSELQHSYLFSSESDSDLYKAQTKNFYHELLGKKIISFGKRYDVYEINDKYKNVLMYLSTNSEGTSFTKSEIEFNKTSSQEYSIQIKNLKGKQKLAFLDTYSPYWTIYASDKKTIIPLHNHEHLFGYANAWTLDSEEIKKKVNPKLYITNPDGSISFNGVLYFQPYNDFKIVTHVSILSVGISILVLFFLYSKQIFTRYYKK